MTARRLLLAAWVGFAAVNAWACRCAEQPLAAYYEQAESVFAARIDDVSRDDFGLRLTVTVLGEPWKGGLAEGSALTLSTADNSAACGLVAQAGEVWLVFTVSPATGAQLNSCDGSRPLLLPDRELPPGFIDVPVHQVARQLNALAGLELLQTLGTSSSPRLLGLLDLESLAHGAEIPVYASATDRSAVIGEVAVMDDLLHREAGYEFSAAEVYGQSDFGYQIALQRDRQGWIAAEYAGTWFPYEQLVVRRLNYLVAGWHRFLWPDPGAGIPFRVSRADGGGGARAASVTETVRIADSLWLRVDVLEGDGCDGRERRIIASGWTPAWDAAGQPAAWFHSRGC